MQICAFHGDTSLYRVPIFLPRQLGIYARQNQVEPTEIEAVPHDFFKIKAYTTYKAMKLSYLLRPLVDLKFCSFSLLKKLSKYSSLYFINYCMSYYLIDKGMRPIGASQVWSSRPSSAPQLCKLDILQRLRVPKGPQDLIYLHIDINSCYLQICCPSFQGILFSQRNVPR